MTENVLSELEYSEKAAKRAEWESFEFSVPATGVVVVANASYGNEKDDHTHSVNVERGVPVGCSCKSDEYQDGACKHRVAVAINTPVLEAATAPKLLADGGVVSAAEPPESDASEGCPNGNGDVCEVGTGKERPEMCWPCFEESRA